MSTSTVEPTLPEFTSIQGAATLLACSTDTVRRMIYSGKLPHARLGRTIRIPLSALTLESLNGEGGAK
ncbi:helix-turn-helix domain-containing protein [Flaviflexus ciconiae]|nr:helix-turn-helix domain-containing protein [Flaviflexus ciconiae]